MFKENLEINGSEGLMTAPEFFGNLFDRHPEILQISMASYTQAPHGVPSADIYREYLPILDEKRTLAEGRWRITHPMAREIVAIGSMVDVCNTEGCTHSFQSHDDILVDIWWRWHDGDFRPCGSQKSFIFLDIEVHNHETLEIIREVLLPGADCDWYVLDSGAGFHIVLDKLVDLDVLAEEYGFIILFFGMYLGDTALEGWGNDLACHGKEVGKVRDWCHDVLEVCGHVDEPLSGTRKEAHVLDLRHTAHSLLRVLESQDALVEYSAGENFPSRAIHGFGGAYLRISPKRQGELPPVLIAQKTDQGYREFKRDFLFGSQRQERLF